MLIKPGLLQFAEYLKQLPPALVIDYFFSDKSSGRKILSSEMINDCANKCSDPKDIRRRFLSLDNKQRLRCAQVYLMGSEGSDSVAGAGLDDPVVASFLGYAARDQEGRERVFGFAEFEPILREHFAQTIAESAVWSEDKAQLGPVCRWRCCNDIALMVSLAMQHLLVRKRSGKLSKATLQLVKKLILTGEMHKIEDAENLVNVILDYCTVRKLIDVEETGYSYCASTSAAWLALPIEQKIGDITSYCVLRCGGWNRDLLMKICETAPNRWMSDASFPESDRSRLREMLLVYRFIGMIELHKSGDELLFQRVRNDAVEPIQEGNLVVIMPDFNVVIKQSCPTEDLFLFACFCRMCSFDRVYHGCIEKAVLIEALCSDVEGEQIIDSLKKWNAPSNVMESVREWIREFGRLAIIKESVIVCSDARVTEQIAAYEQLQPHLERLNAHSVFRIRPGSENSVRDIIRKLGFDERMPALLKSVDETRFCDETVTDETDQTLWTLVVENEPQTEKASPLIRNSKYGSELKTLELSETVQVIDYAILTSQRIVISYEGSPYLRKGVYTLLPITCGRGPEPMLEAQLPHNGARKQFYIKKIGAIGVIS